MSLRSYAWALALIVLLSLLSCSAWADFASITYTYSIPATQTNWGATGIPMIFPKWDPALGGPSGALKSVHAVGDAYMAGSYKFTNTTAGLNGGLVAVGVQFVSPLVNSTAAETKAVNLLPLGSSTLSFSGATTGTWDTTDPTYLTQFTTTTPPENISLAVFALGGYQWLAGGAGIAVERLSLTGRVDGSVTYTYATPEPGSLALFALALPTAGLLLRRRKRSA